MKIKIINKIKEMKNTNVPLTMKSLSLSVMNDPP